MHTDINSKVSFQVIPAVLEAIKDAEYEGTYVRPVSIQLFNIHIFLLNSCKCYILYVIQSGDSKSETVKFNYKVCGPNASFTTLRNTRICVQTFSMCPANKVNKYYHNIKLCIVNLIKYS